MIHYRFKTVLFISLMILLTSAFSSGSAEETGSVDARRKIESRTPDNDNILKIILLYDEVSPNIPSTSGPPGN